MCSQCHTAYKRVCPMEMVEIKDLANIVFQLPYGWVGKEEEEEESLHLFQPTLGLIRCLVPHGEGQLMCTLFLSTRQ